jgi:7-cyano-7-deazaguanine reductase
VCVESKSLKLYLHSMRNTGRYCEALAATIAGDLAKALRVTVRVTITQKARGGVSIVASAHMDAAGGRVL